MIRKIILTKCHFVFNCSDIKIELKKNISVILLNSKTLIYLSHPETLSYLQLQDVDFKVSYAGGRCDPLQPLQLRQHPAQPGSDVTEVGVQLLPLLQVLLDVRLAFDELLSL